LNAKITKMRGFVKEREEGAGLRGFWILDFGFWIEDR
jgi:hypothetical protein